MKPGNIQTQIEKEKISQLIKETIDGGLRQRVIDEVLDVWEVIAPRIREIAEWALVELREALKGLVPDEYLNEPLSKLPNDLVYFLAMGMERAVNKAFELAVLGVGEKVEMTLNNFLRMPEVLESASLPEEVKKALNEWWAMYREQFTFPAGVFLLNDGGIRVCVAYNTARLFAICAEECIRRGKEEVSCRERCKDYLAAVGYGAGLARKQLQEVLDSRGIKHSNVDLELGGIKYACVDIEKR